MKTLTRLSVLLITLIISVTLIKAASSPQQNVTTFNSENGVTIRIPENITTMFDRTGTVTPNIWKKFIGETVPDADSVPDIIDYSYAGYKYGEEAIPDIANSEWTVRNAIDYGAIPNDMKSDTEALRRFFSRDVPSNTILYIPVGRYDINMIGDSNPGRITATFDYPNIIVRGDGAEGYKRGGTSIYMHEKPIDSKGKPYYYAPSFGFNGNWRDGPRGGQTTVTGFHEAGAMSFTVANGSTFFAGSFIELQQISLFTEDTPENSKIFQFNVGLPHTTTSQYYGSNIANGLPLSEKHQIDRVEGNTIYIKDPLMTPINNNIKVKGIKLMQNIGIEDIHFDFGQNGRYTHHTNADIGHGRQGVGLSNLAHSWIKHVRVTNAMSSVWIRQCYATSAMGILLENVNHVKQAHYGGDVGSASRIFVGLFEENNRNSQKLGTGTVLFMGLQLIKRQQELSYGGLEVNLASIFMVGNLDITLLTTIEAGITNPVVAEAPHSILLDTLIGIQNLFRRIHLICRHGVGSLRMQFVLDTKTDQIRHHIMEVLRVMVAQSTLYHCMLVN